MKPLLLGILHGAVLAFWLLVFSTRFDGTEFRTVAAFTLTVTALAALLEPTGRGGRRTMTIKTTTTGLVCNGQALDAVVTECPDGTPASEVTEKHLEAVCAVLEEAGCECD